MVEEHRGEGAESQRQLCWFVASCVVIVDGSNQDTPMWTVPIPGAHSAYFRVMLTVCAIQSTNPNVGFVPHWDIPL